MGMNPSRAAPGLYAAVALGGLAGGMLRVLASTALEAWLGPAFPWGTLFVNALGSLVIGFYAAVVARHGWRRASPSRHLLVTTGFCGGFTTFSAFSLETLQLVQRGSPALAGIYIGLSVVAWLGAVWLGDRLGRRCSARQ
jgi:fluoride exporter